MTDVAADSRAPAGDAWLEEVGKEPGLAASYEEHRAGRLETIRRQPQLVAWCLFAIFTTLLVSFENQAVGTVLSIPRFRQDFGHYYDGSYVLYTKWQSAYYGAPLAATIISSLSASWVSDRVGRKPLLIGAILVSVAAIAVEFVAETNQVFFGGKFLSGFATGIIWPLAMAYVGEVSCHAASYHHHGSVPRGLCGVDESSLRPCHSAGSSPASLPSCLPSARWS